MQSQAERDRKTVVISSSLLLFAAVLGVGSAVLWAGDALFHIGTEVSGPLFGALAGAAGLLSVWHLLRAQKH